MERERQKVREDNEFSLFSLYGVSWGHVVTGDVTFLSGVNGASLPPVAFPEEKKSKEKVRNRQYRHKHIGKIHLLLNKRLPVGKVFQRLKQKTIFEGL